MGLAARRMWEYNSAETQLVETDSAEYWRSHHFPLRQCSQNRDRDDRSAGCWMLVWSASRSNSERPESAPRRGLSIADRDDRSAGCSILVWSASRSNSKRPERAPRRGLSIPDRDDRSAGCSMLVWSASRSNSKRPERAPRRGLSIADSDTAEYLQERILTQSRVRVQHPVLTTVFLRETPDRGAVWNARYRRRARRISTRTAPVDDYTDRRIPIGSV